MLFFHHTDLNDGFCRIHLLIGRIQALFRLEGCLHTAADVDSPADVLNPFQMSYPQVSVLRVNADNCGDSQCQDQEGDNKKIGLPCRFIRVSSNMLSLSAGGQKINPVTPPNRERNKVNYIVLIYKVNAKRQIVLFIQNADGNLIKCPAVYPPPPA